MKYHSSGKIRLFLVICIAFVLLATLVACGWMGSMDISEHENYEEVDGWLLVKEYFDDGRAYYEIVGITEELAMQEEIVMPTSINDIPVVSVGYNKFEPMRDNCPNKMFVSSNIWSFNFPYISSYKASYSGFPKANKFIFLDFKAVGYLPGFITWNEKFWKTPYKSATIYVAKGAINDFQERTSDCPDAVFIEANVSYFYNYEGAPNEGYCWIDNLEYYEKIITKPQTPVREGYIFNGWYKDAECTMPVDLNKFRMKTDSAEFYAGWKQGE